jgi:lysophospholipase L1-like esterase
MLPDSVGHVLYNLGVRGELLAAALTLSHTANCPPIRSRISSPGEIRNRVPDLIILSVGVNDTPRLRSPKGKNYTDFSQFELEIATLLDQAKQLCPVLFVGIVPVDETKMPFLDCLFYNHADQYSYKEATKQACEQR